MSQTPTSQPQLLDFNHFYLVGIKGVAMTSLAQCLLDAGKTVRGSDLDEDFVTKDILESRKIEIDNFQADFSTAEIKPEAIIYTAAHQGVDHPQVQAAIKAGLPVYSQAEALGELFNQKAGIAVCGVGGKSSTSAMITWVFRQLKLDISFSVGVGKIIGLAETGAWRAQSQYFVAEADEYVIDCNALKKDQAPTPRFSFLKPAIAICTNLRFDHPDVYVDFAATKAAFKKFFLQLKPNGQLIVNADNPDLLALAQEVILERPDIQLHTFAWSKSADFRLANWQVKNGQSLATIYAPQAQAELRLQIPGQYNLMNALAAIAGLHSAQIDLKSSCQALASFKSTQRRFELVNIKQGRQFFDDYAHHPSELSEVIRTLNQYFPDQKKIIAFQPHTYSRTKQLFNDFVDALGSNLSTNDQLIILDIFASAREVFDYSVSSQKLVAAIQAKFPQARVKYVSDIASLANYLASANYNLAITVGAGDIYQVYDQLFLTDKRMI